MTYKAKQGDVVWLDFDPSEGHEIRKRCPAVVLSSNAYNRATGFVIVAPITSTIRTLPGYVILYPIKFVVRLSLRRFILWMSLNKATEKSILLKE